MAVPFKCYRNETQKSGDTNVHITCAVTQFTEYLHIRRRCRNSNVFTFFIRLLRHKAVQTVYCNSVTHFKIKIISSEILVNCKRACEQTNC